MHGRQVWQKSSRAGRRLSFNGSKPNQNVGAGLLANAVCQSQMYQLNHRFREQARSHILVRFTPVAAQPAARSAAFLPHLPAVHK